MAAFSDLVMMPLFDRLSSASNAPFDVQDTVRAQNPNPAKALEKEVFETSNLSKTHTIPHDARSEDILYAAQDQEPEYAHATSSYGEKYHALSMHTDQSARAQDPIPHLSKPKDTHSLKNHHVFTPFEKQRMRRKAAEESYVKEKTATYTSLCQSISNELTRFFQSKTSFGYAVHQQMSKEPLNLGAPGMYGLPFLPNLNLSQPSYWTAFAQQLTRIISHFEPRLEKPCVMVESYDKVLSAACVRVTGTVCVDNTFETVTFYKTLA